ncbi:hypothetical protein [Fournierella sp.]|uniref:hypothetical protein n=1 Tax=Allofournierella sp. TaxID=1940256 RepID=UPI0025BCD16B|nr:hypothetical protein [Fournierella sp.]
MDVSDYSNELQTYLLGHGDDLLAHIIQFNEVMMRYQAAIKEVSTKLEILKSCADTIAETDRKMLELRRRIEQQKDGQTEKRPLEFPE